MKKSMKKKLVLSKETMGSLLAQASGGVITALCTPTWNCPTDPNICQSGKYPC